MKLYGKQERCIRGMWTILIADVKCPKKKLVTGDMCLCGNYILCLNSPPDICGLEALFL